MTNYEKIKNMSIEEMAKLLGEPSQFCTVGNGECVNAGYAYTCEAHAKEWLDSEVKE